MCRSNVCVEGNAVDTSMQSQTRTVGFFGVICFVGRLAVNDGQFIHTKQLV